MDQYPTYTVRTTYTFCLLEPDSLEQLQTLVRNEALRCDIRGLIILASEGLNCTFCGTRDNVDIFTELLKAALGVAKLDCKDCPAEHHVFPRLKVSVRDEIVTLNMPDLNPDLHETTHIEPHEWHELLQKINSDEPLEDTVLYDTRNDYETQLGMFSGAVDPKIKKFTEFPLCVEKQSPEKDKTILMYCTGGIRCEKAAIDLKNRGYSKVYQLKGGILNYLKHYPDGFFKGECFVFDARVAVDSALEPTKQWKLCPHCGNPGDLTVSCKNCSEQTTICSTCHEESPWFHTCSKNCAYHQKLQLSVLVQTKTERQ